MNQAVSTDVDSSGALKKAWNGAALGQEVQAQVLITTAFGQVAAKGIGDYADKKREEAKSIGDKDEAAKWDEGGVYRVAAHTAAGALSGGIAGAVGAASSATLMPMIGKQIDAMDLPDPVKQALGAATAAAIGAATGGTAGAATAFNIGDCLA